MKTIPSFVKRMIEEHKALNEKCVKLYDYLSSDKGRLVITEKITVEELNVKVNKHARNAMLMNIQLQYMTGYLTALGDRINEYGVKVIPTADHKSFRYLVDADED